MKKLLHNCLGGAALAALCFLGVQNATAQTTEEVTFDFTSYDVVKSYDNNLPATDNWSADGSNKYTELTSLKNGDVTLNLSKQNGTGVPRLYLIVSSDKYDLRISQNNQIEVVVPEGYYLKKILFDGTSNTNAAAQKLSLVGEVGGTLENTPTKCMTWTAAEGQHINSLSVTTTGSTYRLQGITVSYEAPAVDEPKPSVPEVLYFVGDVYAYNNELQSSWNPVNPIEFTKAAEGEVFTLTGVELKGSYNMCYFNFLNAKGEWETLEAGDPFRYGPAEPNTDVTVGVATAFQLLDAKLGYSWYLPDGVYDFSVDFSNNTFTATKSAVEPFEPKNEAPANLYILGNIEGNSWAPENAPAFTSEEEGVFTISNVSFVAEGTNTVAYFAFINEQNDDWGVINDGKHRYGPLSNGTEIQLSPATNEFTLVGDVSWTIQPGAYDLKVDFNTMEVTVEKYVAPVKQTTVDFYFRDADDDDMEFEEPWKKVTVFNQTAKEYVELDGAMVTFSFTEATELKIAPEVMDECELVVEANEDASEDYYTLTQEGSDWYLTLQPDSEGLEFTVKVYAYGQAPKEIQNIEVGFNIDGVDSSIENPYEKLTISYFDKEEFEDVNVPLTSSYASVTVPEGTTIDITPVEGYIVESIETYQSNANVSKPSDVLGEWKVSIEAGDNVILNIKVAKAPAYVGINFATNSVGAQPENFVNVTTEPDQKFVVKSSENELTIPNGGVRVVVTPTTAYLEEGSVYVISHVEVSTIQGVEVPTEDYASYGVTLSGDMNEWILDLTSEADGLVFTFYVETEGYVGVNSLNAVDNDAVIYNLQGVRVNGNSLSNGIYIINGKKVMVK